jgi:hypothetical protein
LWIFREKQFLFYLVWQVILINFESLLPGRYWIG